MSAPVVVVGAGPAGLVTAIHLARRGLEVVVCEQRSGPPDKACGEGLMPAGVAQLDDLGVLARLSPKDFHRLSAVCYVQEDGSRAAGRLPSPGGLGIRRTVLTRVLAEVAAESGATLHWSCRVGELARHAGGLRLETTAGPLEASLLVAADGLHSRLRQGAGLAGRAARRRRFGMRRHYRIRPWTDAVEVHLAPGKEAFLTPVGPELVGLAVLWERGGKPLGTGPGVDFAALLASFPQVAERLAGAAVDGKPRGAGPLDQRVVSPVADRIALVGDAAGYLDAITGEGLSLAFESAAALAAIAPRALTSGASRAALRPYARAHARHYRRYALVARVVLSVARRPRLRRKLVRWLGQRPGQLERWIRWGIG